MKKYSIIFFGCVFSILLSTSCTVSKRLYESGYYVDWHGKQRHNLSNRKKQNLENYLTAENQSTITIDQEQSALFSSIDTADYIIISSIEKEEIIELNKQKPEVNQQDKAFENYYSTKKHDFKKISHETSFKTQNDRLEPKIHWAAGLSLGLSILGFVTPLFLSIAAIIFGIIALRKIKSNPEKYKGSTLAIAGIVLGALSLILLGAYLVFVVMMMG